MVQQRKRSTRLRNIVLDFSIIAACAAVELHLVFQVFPQSRYASSGFIVGHQGLLESLAVLVIFTLALLRLMSDLDRTKKE